MENVNKNVHFVRIRGRIVPIRRKEATSRGKLALSGAAHVAAAGAVAYGVGAGTAAAVQRASAGVMKSRALYKFHRGSLKGLLHATSKAPTGKVAMKALTHTSAISRAVKMRAWSNVAFKARNPVLAGGALVAGVLAGAGVLRLNRAIQGRKKKGMQNSAVSTGAAIGALATAAVYYKKLPLPGGLGNVAQNAFARVRGLPRPHLATWWRR